MDDATDLKRLEKDAYRKFYEDGLFDVYLGLLLFLMPFASRIDRWFGGNEAAAIAVLLLAYGILVLVWTVGRKRFVTPRIGTIKLVAIGVYKLVRFVRDYPVRKDGMALHGD